MRNIRNTLLYVIASLMFLATAIGFDKNFGTFFLAGGSDVLMSYASTDLFVRLLFWLAFVVCVILFDKFLSKKLSPVLLVIFFTLWVLSGRMIAIFPDGRLVGGWFYIATETANLCKDATDCEMVLYNETSYTRKPLWCISVKNKEMSVVKFVGPFIENEVSHLFARFAKAKDTSAYKHFTELVSYFRTNDTNNINKSSIPFGVLREILSDKIDTTNEISIAPVKMINNKYGYFFILKVACYAGAFCDTYHLLSFDQKKHLKNIDIIGLDAGEGHESTYFSFATDTDTSLRTFEITVDEFSDKEPDTIIKILILK